MWILPNFRFYKGRKQNENAKAWKTIIPIKTQTNQQDDESIKGIVQIKITEVLKMIKEVKIKDAKTVCSILMCTNIVL